MDRTTEAAEDTGSRLAPVGQDDSIRAIRRGLAMLQAFNRFGAATVVEVARATAIPYPTACRIAQTLAGEGMIEREAGGRRYRPTALVRTLASGFRDDAALIAVARPYVLALTDELLWPISLCGRVGGRIVIQYSTHRRTTLTLSHYAPGFMMPLTDCAAGRAYLAFCPDRERERMRLGLEALGEPIPVQARAILADRAVIDGIRAKGFAGHARNPNNADPGKISSLAAPIFDGDRLVSTLVLSFFASAMTMGEAETRYGARIAGAAAAIGAALAASR